MNTIEKSAARWYHIAQAVCILVGFLLLALSAPVLLSLKSELPEPQLALAAGLFLILGFQWAILSVLIMIFLEPKRRAA
jgi:uncharacterized membrane protein YphA (DoxX/SURF4 family)